MSEILSIVERMRRAAERIAGMQTPCPQSTPLLGPGCCPGELEELQEHFRGGLPPDFIEFLSLCRLVVATDLHNGYYLYSPLSLAQRDSSFPRFLHVDLGGSLQEVWVLAIGGDGGGNQFLMGTGPTARGHIWKWSHEYPPRFDGMAHEGLTLVATSFDEFLGRVVTDWEHFIAEDHEWEYLAG